MSFLRMGSAGAVLVMLVAGGCQNAVHDENIALHQQNRELQTQLSDTESRLRAAPDPAQVQAELAARDARIRELQGDLDAHPAAAMIPASGSLGGMETRRDAAAGTLTVNVPGDVLFEPGMATLGESAKATLSRVVKALKKEYPGKPLRIDGHTDSDPIVRSHWKNNMDLSEARATAVARYLATQGVEAKLITIRGYGDTHPRGADKAVNRRVEIVVFTS